MQRLLRPVGQALLFGGKVCAVLLVLVLTLGAIGVSQRFILFSESCGEESPAEGYWLCVERASLKTYLANDTAYQQGGGEASTPSLEAARAVDPDLTGATSLANAVTICRTGTATCADAVRMAFYCDAGNICRIEFYDAANALLTEAKAVYSGSSWLISIDTAGTQTTCLTMDDTGLMTYAALESCGRLLGLVHLGFTEDDGTHTCAAGDFGLWADLSENKLKACQNGSASDLLAAASGDITAVGDCSTGACFASPTATHAFMGGTPAAFRALADADIPNNITVASTAAIDTTSTLTGLFKRSAISADTTTLTQADHCGGAVIENTDTGDALDITLMGAVEGCRFCVLASTTEVITVDTADGTDTITLCASGTCTALTAGNAIDLAGSVGAMVCFMGRSASSWYAYVQFATAADGGAD